MEGALEQPNQMVGVNLPSRLREGLGEGLFLPSTR